MLYLERDQLCILHTKTERETISKEELKKPLLEKPCNLVYFETDQGLYGIVSSGDIFRTDGDEVRIRRSFTLLKREEVMEARRIFKENSKIREIPVVAKGHLEGEFDRLDDKLMLDRYPSLARNAYTAPYFASQKKIALVRPAASRPYKEAYFERMREVLDMYHADYAVIDMIDMIRDVDRYEQFLLVDAQEKAGALLCLYLYTGRRVYYKAVSYCQLLERLESSEVIDYQEFFENYQKQGVDVILLTAKRTQTPYFQKTERALRQLFPQEYPDNLNERAQSLAGTFFDDMANEPGYVEDILRGYFVVQKDTQYMHLKDMQSRYINVRFGERVTVDQPAEYERTIYFFGPCLVIGNYVADEYTIESRLQKMLNERGIPVRVVNCGCWGGNVANVSRISSTAFKKGDIMVALMEDLDQSAGPFKTVDLWEVAEENEIPTEWMLDNLYHVNHHVTEIYAEAIFRKLLAEGMLEGCKAESQALVPSRDIIDQFYIKKYFSGVDLGAYKTAACCVVNGNPFTNGHKALIERAAAENEHVYLLIVREDASLFSFAERFTMAVEALKHLPNVTVVPSGMFIGNVTIFPAYYARMEIGDVEHQAQDHIRAFATVAKALHATRRYMGEEPTDTITNLINENCVRMLPELGIETVIVPRVKFGGDYVTGSKVRKLAETCDPSIADLVPETTADVIFCQSINAIS